MGGKSTSVQIDVHDKRGHTSEQRGKGEPAPVVMGHCAQPEQHIRQRHVKTPLPVSCQEMGNAATGASRKNCRPSTRCRIAFQDTGPRKAATDATAITKPRRGLTTATNSPAAM